MISKRLNRLLIGLAIAILPLSIIGTTTSFDTAYASSPTRYEAENASINNAEKKYVSSTGSYAFGVSGDGFVGFNGGSDSTITFTVSVDKNGVYELAVKYAVGMDGSGVKIECNNLSDSINFTENNGWGSFNTTSPLETTVRLTKGNNAVIISRAYSDKYGEIDYIEIGEYIEEYEPSGTEGTRYEAENASINNAEKKYVSSNGSYAFGVSGDGFVGFNGGNESSITFTVNVSDQGFYKLYVKYAVGMDGSGVKIDYNGLSDTINFTENNGWGSFNKTSPLETTVRLKKGNNTITISRAYSDKYGEIDYIAIGDCTEIDNPPDLPSGSNWIKYEVEEATRTNVTLKDMFTTGGYARGVSGTGFIGFNAGTNSKVAFKVTAAKDGIYEFLVKYGVEGDGSGVIITSNDTAQIAKFTQSKGWGSFNTTDPLITKVVLAKGENTVTLSKVYADKYGDIDYVAVGKCLKALNPLSLPHGTSWNKYEAEDGEVVLGTRKSQSKLKYVGNLDYDLSYIDFNIKGYEAGAYEIKIKYSTDFNNQVIKVYAGERGRDGRLDLYDEIKPYANGWANFISNAKTFVSLKEDSFIRIYSKYVEIDYIEISNKVGDFFRGSYKNVEKDGDITDGGFTPLGGTL